ncbi:SH3 domain-containing protein [Streptomyces chattanoogensis]|uniref:SH3b domain-containing protein n=1 Tax=Streptomyces chattanoogensis TaxID=66876 RepID=A0A0N0GXQ4_9ACTN|nr:SH3 domain-containing protein [Streptomyces chattanoogensis]KPC61162.1 hypothetical protein ADL29_25625 [Streptomyces chattanoogensis]
MTFAVRGKNTRKRAFALTGLVLAAAIGGATLSTPAYADDVYGHCTGDGVRIRSTPSTSGAVLGLCYTGERLAHRDVSSDGQWDKVYDVDSGVSGWISHGYFSW